MIRGLATSDRRGFFQFLVYARAHRDRFLFTHINGAPAFKGSTISGRGATSGLTTARDRPICK